MQLVYRFGIYSVLGSIPLMSLLVLPAAVGVLVDESSLSESQAGWAASINFIGGALVALVMAFQMQKLDLRRVAVWAFLFSALGDGLSAFAADNTTLFMAIRFATGIGTGAAYTVAIAAFARERHVDRGYGIFVTLQFIISGLGLYFLPVYSSLLGVTGMYLGFAALDLFGATLGHYLPGRLAARPAAAPVASGLRRLLARAAVFGTLGFALFEAANTAQFTYVERYGFALSFSEHQVGTALLIGSFAGIPGAFSIVLLGSRFGRKGPLALGTALSLAGLTILLNTNQFYWYLSASVMLGFAWAFCLPYIQGLLATLDPHGSAVAAGSATSTIGGAIGPGLAAMVVGGGNYHGVFVFAMMLFIAALLSFFLTGGKQQVNRGKE